MGRRPQRHGRQAGGGEAGDRRSLLEGQDERQRTGPISGGQLPRAFVEGRDFIGLFDIAHMDNERIEARPPLRFIDPRDRFAVGRVGGETIDCLGRHGDDFAAQDQPRRLGDGLGTVGQNAGVLRAHCGDLPQPFSSFQRKLESMLPSCDQCCMDTSLLG